MSYRVLIEGICGDERYLVRRQETTEEKKAQRFRSEDAAQRAAREHIAAFPPVIQRYMKFRLEAAP